ncbi:MAG TPA: sortase [Actinomycetota bacterium]|nr:sortase [Actinomycetota bacterium]
MQWVRVLGKLLISMGVGVFLFIVWTLYGTGIYTQQQQQQLAEEFDRLPALERQTEKGQSFPAGPPPGYDPAPGAPIFRMHLPTIEDKPMMVVEGVGTDELKLGPGHYPSCRPGFERPLCTSYEESYPGERGRVIVSGHRTTYGMPFWSLDKMEKGDPIHFETQWGEYTYLVTGKEVVPANSDAIVVPSDKYEVVLTTCNPRYSAAERLIVYAELDMEAAAR